MILSGEKTEILHLSFDVSHLSLKTRPTTGDGRPKTRTSLSACRRRSAVVRRSGNDKREMSNDKWKVSSVFLDGSQPTLVLDPVELDLRVKRSRFDMQQSCRPGLMPTRLVQGEPD